MRLLAVLTLTLAIAACTTVPEQIQGEFSGVSPRMAGTASIGAPVRWGGLILSASNLGDRTCFEVLSRELDRYLRPEQEDFSNGRFIACKDGFQDPLVFGKGREITVTGVIRNIRVEKVEEFSFRYPVVDVDNLVLWEKRRQVVVYRGFHSPWYHPYPWRYPYPYWGFHHPIGGTYGWAEQRSLLPDPSVVNGEDAADSDEDEPR